MKRRFLGHSHMSVIGVCPQCGEAYPREDGPICRGCQGEAPYVTAGRVIKAAPAARVVPVEEAVGKTAAHDMTRIEPGVFEGPELRAGAAGISVGGVCRLQQMGRFHVAVRRRRRPKPGSWCTKTRPPKPLPGAWPDRAWPTRCRRTEGKIDFTAQRDGLFCVDVERLRRFNMVPEVMAATRQDATVVDAGARLAGTRAIPLHISRERLGEALAALGETPLLRCCRCAGPRWASS